MYDQQTTELTGLLFISPWILGFLLLQLYPLVASLFYAFTDFELFSSPVWVGLENFKKMFFHSKDFWKSLSVTFQYVFIAVPLKLGFALFIAMLLTSKIKGINVFRTIFYLPSILGGSVAIAILWRFLFMRSGIVNKILSVFSVEPIDWLGSPKIALLTISLLTVWQFGSSMVLFLAGLKQVPDSLVEAATIDGAGSFRVFFSIKLPLLTPIVFFNLIMQMINAFQEFTGAFVITQGGPVKSTYLYGMMLYQEGFKFFRMGYASALSWILFLIIMAFTALSFRSSESWVHYGD